MKLPQIVSARRKLRLKNEHKDGETVVEGFIYALTSGGNITRTTHADGSYWDYGYDARDRLTAAVRKDDGGQTLASYAYTYDAGDNLLTKVEAGVTTTFVYNNANELVSSTTGGVTTEYGFDGWGRMTSKAIDGSYSAAYAYRYGDKLCSVASDFPDEGNVAYEYGGDGKRHERTSGGRIRVIQPPMDTDAHRWKTREISGLGIVDGGRVWPTTFGRASEKRLQVLVPRTS